jgi:hypothetical protein
MDCNKSCNIGPGFGRPNTKRRSRKRREESQKDEAEERSFGLMVVK